jgi:tetraacyldisaccharide 4'-kinase
VLVDPARHRADEVGDEPLLLARAAPTIVARVRPGGARLAAQGGAGVVIMDDGFQNPSLAKDFSILVVDGQRGIGNGRIIPAGPLRAPLDAQLAHSDALVVIGAAEGAADVAAAARGCDIPVFAARLVPDAGFIAALGSGRVLAFAGIGDPKKFFWMLTGLGIAVAAMRSFPDHHRYTAAEAKALCDDADRDGLVLVTTEKDLVRIIGDAALGELAAHAHALPVTLSFEDEAGFAQLLLHKLAAARSGRK